MAALVKLKDQGKIRAIGVSNYDASWIKKAAAAGPLASLQPPYSLIQRKIEKEILPTCRELNDRRDRLLADGARLARPARSRPTGSSRAGDHRSSHKFFKPENRKRVLESLEKVRPIAEKHGVSLAQMVINWTIQVPGSPPRSSEPATPSRPSTTPRP